MGWGTGASLGGGRGKLLPLSYTLTVFFICPVVGAVMWFYINSIHFPRSHSLRWHQLQVKTGKELAFCIRRKRSQVCEQLEWPALLYSVPEVHNYLFISPPIHFETNSLLPQVNNPKPHPVTVSSKSPGSIAGRYAILCIWDLKCTSISMPIIQRISCLFPMPYGMSNRLGKLE